MSIKPLNVILTTLVLAIVFICPLQAVSGQQYKLGVLAKRGKEKAVNQWKPFTEYLGKATGLPFQLVPLSFKEIEPAIKDKKVDYILANSAIYVDQEQKFGIKVLASLLNLRMGKALNQFSGVIFVKKDSPIKKIGDIKGKTFMCVKKSSFGGGQMAFRHLIENGINPFKETVLMEGRKHDNVVMAVQAGMVDVGTVRSDTFERMEAEGKIKMSDFRIIDQAKDDFPFVHSTVLYPEWPLAFLAHVPADVNTKVKKALLGLKQDNGAAKQAKIAGWTEPLDYAPVAKCLIICILNGLQQ